MRTTLWFCSALIGISLLGGQLQTPAPCPPTGTDPYSIAFVNSAFQYFRRTDKGLRLSSDVDRFLNGYNSPSLHQLGDAVSIAVLKICTLDELIKSENARAYLTSVRNSFTDRSKVLEKSDQEPRVTALVLGYLEKKEMSEPLLEKRIAYMKTCVKDFTCSSQGEADFFKNHQDGPGSL